MIGGPLKSARQKTCLSLALMSALLSSQVARADDLTGVWATDASNCSKIFSKTGTGVSFAKDSDLYGSGFIIDARRITTPMARCDIKTNKQDGSTVHLIAACATDIMLSDVQFSVRSVNANEILRMFPNMPGMETLYHRCAM